MSHTPGPWIAVPKIPDAGGVVTSWGIATDDEIIAEFDLDNLEADCKLAAAAPDLLHGLKQAIRILELHQYLPLESWLETIRKAEGATP